MPAAGPKALAGSPALIVDDEEERRKLRFLPDWDAQKFTHDFSRGFNSIIHNEDLWWGATVGVIGFVAKTAFNASGAWAVTLGIAAFTGALNGGKKAFEEYDGNKWKFAKTLLKSTALSTIGSAFSFFALDGIVAGVSALAEHFNIGERIADLTGVFSQAQAPEISAPSVEHVPDAMAESAAPSAEMTAAPPVEAPQADIVAATDAPEAPQISQQWQDIQAAAEAGDSQAKKDLAMALFNGSHGFEVDTQRALELYTEAAEAGNVQAKVDLAYLEYHGLTGVNPNPEEAIEAMRGLAGSDARAAELLAAWEPQVEAPVDVGGGDVPEQVNPPASTDGAEPISFTPPEDSSLSMQFWTNVDSGEIQGVIHNAAGRVAPGTVFTVPVAQISLN